MRRWRRWPRPSASTPNFAMTYVYRGNVYEVSGDAGAAAQEYQHALALEPTNEAARQGLSRVMNRR